MTHWYEFLILAVAIFLVVAPVVKKIRDLSQGKSGCDDCDGGCGGKCSGCSRCQTQRLPQNKDFQGKARIVKPMETNAVKNPFDER